MTDSKEAKQRKESRSWSLIQVSFSTTLGTEEGKQEDHKIGYLLLLIVVGEGGTYIFEKENIASCLLSKLYMGTGYSCDNIFHSMFDNTRIILALYTLSSTVGNHFLFSKYDLYISLDLV